MTRRGRGVVAGTLLCALAAVLATASSRDLTGRGRVVAEMLGATGRERPPTPSRGSTSPAFAFAGCSAVRTGPVCALAEERELVLWLSADADEAHTFVLDGRVLEPTERRAVGGGVRYRVRVSPLEGPLEVHGATGKHELLLGSAERWDVIERADSLRREGQVAEAERLLQPLLAGNHAVHNRARALRARIALGQGRAREAAEALEQTYAEAASTGLISDAARDAFALAFIQTVMLSDYPAARRTLEQSGALEASEPMARAWRANASGLLAAAVQDWLSAEALFREAVLHAERLDAPRERRDATAHWAHALAELGQTPRAIDSMRAIVAEAAHVPVCERGPLHATLGALGLEAMPRFGMLVDVGAELRTAAELDAICGQPFYERYDLVNLGLWAIEQGDGARAAEQLARLEAMTAGHSTALAIWEAELAARVQLAAGHPERARHFFEREGALALASDDSVAVLRAEVGIAESSIAQGRAAEAVSVLRTADAAAERSLGSLMLGTERDGGFGRRDAAARRLVELLIDLGDTEGAFRAALTVLRRSLGTVTQPSRIQALTPEQRLEWERHIGEYRAARNEVESVTREDWRLSSEKIRALAASREAHFRAAHEHLRRATAVLHSAPGPKAPEAPLASDELSWLLLPARDGAWLSFAQNAGSSSVRRHRGLSSTGTVERGSPLLEGLSDHLRGEPVISIYAYGAAQDLSFAPLDFEGRPLMYAAALVHRLGVQREEPENERWLFSRVGVVGDPTDDLPAARAEAFAVAQRLGLAPERLLLGADASRERVVAAIEQSDLFHYAGHGEHSGDGFGGLRLSSGARLLPSDVLALRAAPTVVVLSACDAGRSATTPLTTGFGLAQAFIVAGSHYVIAPMRPIRDSTASRFIDLFYGAAQEEGLVERLPRAFAKAQQQAHREGLSDWDAFRVYAP